MTRRIDWTSETWGSNVHIDPHGSFVPSAHGQEQEDQR